MTRDEILGATDKEIIEEVNRLCYLYGFQSIIRWDQDRNEEVISESVAEHTFMMMILVNYFLQYEDEDGKLDKIKIYEMCLWHDADEIETGDTISHLKDESHAIAESEVIPLVVSHVPTHMQDQVESLMLEQKDKKSWEAKFVEALDKVESYFTTFKENDDRTLIRFQKYSKETKDLVMVNIDKKRKATEDFPVMRRFVDAIANYYLDNKMYIQ